MGYRPLGCPPLVALLFLSYFARRKVLARSDKIVVNVPTCLNFHYVTNPLIFIYFICHHLCHFINRVLHAAFDILQFLTDMDLLRAMLLTLAAADTF